MITTLKSTVPTHYQRQSISAFGLPVVDHKSGSSSCEATYKTKAEAIAHMLLMADRLAEDEKQRRKMYIDIKKRGHLEYDAAVLSIQ